MAKISFVIPLLNEAPNLEDLYRKIKDLGPGSEIIFINDGSTDSSLEILKKIALLDKDVRVISFRRNLGKAAALKTGFGRASGEIVVTLDADLQDDPACVPAMLEKLQDFDMVVGWKKKRHDPLSKILLSKVFNTVVSKLSGVSLHDFNCGLKVMKSSVAKSLNIYGELHRFIPVLAYGEGFSVTEVEVEHHPRRYGKSKYGLERVTRGFFDFLTIMFLRKFGARPLHFFGLLGGISILIGSIFAVYLSVIHFLGERIGNRPLLVFSVLLILGGLQLLSIGLIAEMIARPKVRNEQMIDYEI